MLLRFNLPRTHLSALLLVRRLAVENKSKPLVLKELKKLWNKEEPDDLPWQQGGFSPTNTLLVDDSPYKALRNPVPPSIFLGSYIYLSTYVYPSHCALVDAIIQTACTNLLLMSIVFCSRTLPFSLAPTATWTATRMIHWVSQYPNCYTLVVHQ